MSQTKSNIVIAGILSAVILAGCGVRDTSEDGVNNTGGGSSAGSGSDAAPSSALGSDTSAIAGFWEPNFGGANRLYVVISDVGDWSYVREDTNDNCYNVDTHPITKVDTNEYSINENGFVYSMIAVISQGGSLEIDIIADNPSSAVYDAVVSIMAQDLQICGN